MTFTDQGYIIKLKKHGESSLIITLVTKDHGKIIGFAKHCLSKKNLSTYQIGNLVTVEAYARLEENMLSFRVELISPSSVNFLSSHQKLNTLSALCGLADSCLPEKEPIENLYQYVDDFINHIHEDNWITYYSYIEYYLIEFLGIGLDLSECSATGVCENLYYVSPKTAKAVSKEAGDPYKDRLFLFPHYILQNSLKPTPLELKDLLNMTGFFLSKNFFQTHNLKFPESRANLLSSLDI